MEPIKVVVHGAAGRMGREVVGTLCREADLTPVGVADAVLEAATATTQSCTVMENQQKLWIFIHFQ